MKVKPAVQARPVIKGGKSKRTQQQEASADDQLNSIIQNAADLERRIVYITGEIDEMVAYRFIVAFQKMDDEEGPITVIINTCGGTVTDGFAIYDMIRNARNEVYVVGMGEIASMGSVIFQAADHRIMSPECTFMIHDVGMHNPPDMNMSQLRILLKDMEYKNSRVCSSLAESSGVPLTKILDWCHQETTFTAKEAVAEGFADAVMDPKRPQRSRR